MTGSGRGPLTVDFRPAQLARTEVDRLLDTVRRLDGRPGTKRKSLRLAAVGLWRVPSAGWWHRRGHYRGDPAQGAAAGRRSSTTAGSSSPGTTTSVWPAPPRYGHDSPTSCGPATRRARSSPCTPHRSLGEDPQEAFNPPQALAASRFAGGYAAAMRAVETAAESAAVCLPIYPDAAILSWPRTLLVEIHRQRASTQRRSKQHWADWRKRAGAAAVEHIR